MTLQAYYPLDEDSGSTAYDYSGNENDGTANGAGPAGTGTVSGPLEATAYNFDGTDDYIDVPNLTDQSEFTFALWINSDVWGSGNNTMMWFGDNANNEEVFIRVDSSDNVDFYYFNGSSNFGIVDYGETPPTGQWVHLCGTFDGTVWTYYADGVEETSVSNSTSSIPLSGPDNSIGSFAGGSGNYFDGSMADVRVYDRALSPSEVAYLYEVSQGGNYVSETKTL